MSIDTLVTGMYAVAYYRTPNPQSHTSNITVAASALRMRRNDRGLGGRRRSRLHKSGRRRYGRGRRGPARRARPPGTVLQ